MASEYKIHRPYIVSALPRPLDHTDGRIVAREVYGQREGQKKRKRTELAVGVDGETASIYDVSTDLQDAIYRHLLRSEATVLTLDYQIPASRLITSYPIPPQESFTCPPFSTRVRRSGNNDVSRYTFIATKDSASQKITLFKDVVHRDGKTTSTTTTQTLTTSPVRYITCSSGSSQPSVLGDLWLICQNGEFVSLSSESLAVQWTGSTKSTIQDSIASNITAFQIDYVSSATVSEFSEGIFKHRSEVFSALPKTVGPDTELLLVLSRSIDQEQNSRHLSVVAVSSSTASDMQRLTPLDVVPLPTPAQGAGLPTYQVDIQSGLLMELQDGAMSVYNLTGAVPKLKSIVQMDNASTFTRLSRPFILSCSLQSIGLYNYQYRSVHAKASLDLAEIMPDNQEPRSCQLLTYLRSQELIVALVDNALVSIQVEPPKNHGKRRKEGLLIDSIGRGSALEIPAKKSRHDKPSVEFSRQVPGTVTESYLAQLQSEIQTADELLSNNELDKWEELLRKKFHIGLKERREAANGENANGATDSSDGPEWDWLTGPSSYPIIDRRWIIYAISQIFSVDPADSEESRPRTRFILPDSNVTTYLVVAGHLTVTNITSAFREDLDGEPADGKSLASDLIQGLTDADPSLSLLLNYLQATKLGEVELLLAIKALMLSMDLLPGTEKLNSMKLLKNEPNDAGEDYEMDLDDLEREIAATEHYLGDDSSSRSRGLTLAFTKLWRLPAIHTIKALRATMRTEEVLSFIYLLRVELVRGAWTTLYIDPTSFDSEGNDPPPDGVIALVADLLGRCLDAVGVGGWLFNDAMSWADKAEAGDFLTALKLEVTAALEGIEEAVYLNGILGEVVRYGFAAQKNGSRAWNTTKPVAMQLEGRESRMLPFGLKTKSLPSKEKVVSGGEVVQRSVRETGHLISQKVEAYSLEKLVV
ncbi:hypothetical protein HJFPF1_06998 [Paramyrothecium foliicola]|nr:hypothetical protein HJFPF1_06998 [Paramyrothecium foliicola]